MSDKLELQVFKKRRNKPLISGYEVRVGKTRISITDEIDITLGKPDRVELLHDEGGSTIGLRAAKGTNGYKIQRSADTTREIATRALISRFNLVEGNYPARKIEGDIIVFQPTQKPIK